MQRPPSNYFDFFGLPHKLNIDARDLESRFYELSKQWHPDMFARANPDDRRMSEIATATLNDGYRTLKDPVARAEYLLKEHGLDMGGQRSNTVPPELLNEVFELNSALEEEGEGSRENLEQFRERFLRMHGNIDHELQQEFEAYDEFENRANLEKIRAILNRRKYISNLVLKVEKALLA
jgi:molecular chaperone HscB